jgi:alpha-1,6-mannosyltransferase
MHVADVTMFYAPQGGGVRRYIEAKRAGLRARGWSHTLLAPSRAAAAQDRDTVSLSSIPLPLSNGYRLPVSSSRAVAELVAIAPAIIEAGDPYHLAWAALEAGRRLAVPVVGFVHSDLPRVLGVRYGASAERLAARYYGRLYRQFDAVLAPSMTVTARLRAWGVSQAQHQPLGVDLDVFSPRRRDARLRECLGIDPDARLLIYAGRFAREKNLDVLARALRELGRPYAAVLVGAGRLPAGLPHNVRVMPFAAEREGLAALLAGADAFVHPGDQETFGLAALEAMACGLPVIAADRGALAELVTAEVGALVRPCNPRELAEAIDSLFRGDLPALAARARARAERYAWPTVLESIAGRYAALAAAAQTAAVA